MKTYSAKKNTTAAKYVSDGKWDDFAAAKNSFLMTLSVIYKMFSVMGIKPPEA